MKKAIVVTCKEVATALGERCIPFGKFADSATYAENAARRYNAGESDLSEYAWAIPGEVEKAQKFFPDHVCVVIREEKFGGDGGPAAA